MPSAAKPLGVGLTVSSEAPLPEGRARTGSAAAGPPDRGLPAQDRPAQAHPPGPRRRCSRVSRRRAPALGRSVRRSPAAGGGRGAGAAAPATCSRAPRTQRSSTYHPVERRPHRCAGHRQAPCTVSMPPGRRAPALRLRRPHRGLQSHESAWSRRTWTWGIVRCGRYAGEGTAARDPVEIGQFLTNASGDGSVVAACHSSAPAASTARRSLGGQWSRSTKSDSKSGESFRRRPNAPACSAGVRPVPGRR